VHRHHGAAQPIYLQSHHVFPKYLQKRVYGDDTVRDNTRADVCGSAHDTVHFFIDHFDDGEVTPRVTVPEQYRAFSGEWHLAVEGWQRYEAVRAESTST
jgi:hypothetical protein